MQKVKALVLLSGGLDSMLAAKVLMEQGIEVTGLSFKSYFFKTDKAKKVAEQLGIKLIEVDFSDEHLQMVKNPKYGYGKNINPCIDCHGLMLEKAREYLTPTQPSPASFLAGEGNEETGDAFDFIATGEVLGERPMSQNKDSLKLVGKISGLQGKLLRPLSAKLLDETEAEKQGKINRDKLLDISGRSRQRQLELVKKYKIKQYASPGGGCLLTDPGFSKKLAEMIKYWPECNGNDIELLKSGRIYWITLKDAKERQGTPHNADECGLMRTDAEESRMVLATIGRNKSECENLEKLKRQGDIVVELAEEMGPTTLIRNPKFKTLNPKQIQNPKFKIQNILEIQVPEELKIDDSKLDKGKSEDEVINFALMLTGYYSTKVRGKEVKIKIREI